MRALRDRLIACTIPARSFVDLSCTSLALRERSMRALGQTLAVICEARGMLWTSGLQYSLFSQGITPLEAMQLLKWRYDIRLITHVLLEDHTMIFLEILLGSVVQW